MTHYKHTIIFKDDDEEEDSLHASMHHKSTAHDEDEEPEGTPIIPLDVAPFVLYNALTVPEDMKVDEHYNHLIQTSPYLLVQRAAHMRLSQFG